MSERILIQFKASGDNKLRASMLKLAAAQGLLEKNTKEMRRALSKLTKTFDNTERKSRLLNNSLATLRSKMLLFSFAMSMGGRQLIEFSKQAANLGAMETAFTNLQGGTENASIAIENLRHATNGTMSSFNLFQQANNAMILGVSKNSEELADMFDVAQRLGRALGVDTKRSVESLITGIGRQSRLMLDNIGIVVKSEEAYDEYAKKLGISTKELTDADKKQAFFNAAMKAGKDALEGLGNEQLSTADKFGKVQATFDDFSASVGKTVTPVVLGFLEGTADFMRKIMETDLETALRQMRELGASVKDITALQRAVALEGATEVLENNLGKIKSIIEGKIFASGLSKEQRIALGAQVREMKSLVDFRQVSVELFDVDATKVNQETVKKLMEDIGNEMKGLDVINSKADQKKLSSLAEQNSELARILQLLVEIQNAEDIIANKPLVDEGDVENVNSYSSSVLNLSKALEKMPDNMKTAQSQIHSLTSAMTNYALSSQNGARTIKGFGNAVISTMERIVSTFLANYATFKLMSFFFPGFSSFTSMPGGGIFSLLKKSPGAASLGGGVGTMGVYPAPTLYHQGGMIQSYHQSGDVPMVGQEGEFVIRRSAVESIGLENLNKMNRTGQASGGANITFTGNIMSDSFIEEEAIPKIKDAIRRGADLGIS